ncbi:MAG: (2Fe-2S)-binding protein, partial [Candidatus Thermoplasmatota archaeon]|nr:(2Fe-2S)-binding protein [Candidatus Thermoplasmatota archaeon]
PFRTVVLPTYHGVREHPHLTPLLALLLKSFGIPVLVHGVLEGVDAASLRAWMLAPVARPPAGGAGRGRVVCNCLNVAEPDIVAEIAAGADLATLQATLKCGTECGSCVPELKRLLAGNRAAA